MMKEFFTDIHYSKNLSLGQVVVAYFLSLCSPFYYIGVNIKNWLYKNGGLEISKIEGAKVISIGNITTGGVGKTPIVAEIANKMAVFHKVAILSRGYGGNLSYEEVSVIKSGGQIHYNSLESGDEPYWLAQNTNTNVAVLTCANRVASGNYAVKKLGCDILILDDGFQHQKLARDINIVVFDAYKFIGNGYILPRGPLREPMSEITRADKIILTSKNLTSELLAKVKENVEREYKKPVLTVSFKVDKIYDLQTHEEMRGVTNIAAFCAIGQPMLFYQYLKNYKMKFVKDFDDHHIYTQDDVDILVANAKIHNIDGFVTTEKDAVKLANLDFQGFKVYVLKLKLDLNIEELLNEKA